ncbi:hypothetical protein SK128_025998 [Halocaridina rubra]|uniref:Uncharacterized protein n=1 Tax=Halocaridina rubra TaxID=373956 RepID=A0AAN8WDW2_HALRR
MRPWRGSYEKLIFIFLSVINMSTARLSIGPNSPYCTRLTDSLDCNFDGVDKAVVLDRFDGEMDKKILEVFVRNVDQLTVTGSICVKLHLNSVSNGIFSRPHACNKEEQLSLRMTNSHVNMIPKYVSRLDMESSSADEFISERPFQSITITNSKLGTISVAQSTASNALIKIEQSEIKVLAKLKIGNGAQLTVINTTINEFRYNCLEIDDATANIGMTNIKRTELAALVLGSKANVVLDHIDGKVTLAGPKEVKTDEFMEQRPPGVPPNIRRPRNNEPNYFWIIPTVLALVEAMIIMVNCTNWFPGLKYYPKRREIEEGARLLSSSRSGEPASYYGQNTQSSVYYSHEDFNSTSLNKRPKGGKIY